MKHLKNIGIGIFAASAAMWVFLITPTIGSFKNGRGELFSSDTFNDRAILVRGVWSDPEEPRTGCRWHSLVGRARRSIGRFGLAPHEASAHIFVADFTTTRDIHVASTYC